MVDDINYLILDYEEEQEQPKRPEDVRALGYKDDADYDRMQKWIKDKQEAHRKWIEERIKEHEQS